jgi:hypothetical protein
MVKTTCSLRGLHHTTVISRQVERTVVVMDGNEVL